MQITNNAITFTGITSISGVPAPVNASDMVNLTYLQGYLKQ